MGGKTNFDGPSNTYFLARFDPRLPGHRAGGKPLEMQPRLAAFPKCYIEQIAGERSMTVFDWIKQAQSLDADGLELYEGFLTSLEDSYIDSIGDAIGVAGFQMPMLCCSPDFTQTDDSARQKSVEHEAQMIRITRRLGGPRSVCRILSGQRRPEVTVEQGVEWVVESIQQLLPVAREYNVILGLENHYKDGFWKYPEFAQMKGVFMAILDAVPDRTHFGVQYDPSNAIVAGDDPLEWLDAVAGRIVSMHASDRYLEPGIAMDELRQSDGTLGYSPHLRHGIIGKGLNDYDAIFRVLSRTEYAGWISIEDGMNGMEEMAESLAFLRRMIDRHFPRPADQTAGSISKPTKLP